MTLTGKAVRRVRPCINTLALGAALVVVLAAGCSTTTGTPQPAPSESSSAPDSLYGAPHVAKPLDTTKFQAQPCSVLTAAEAQASGAASQGEARSDALGPTCGWKNHDTFTSIIVRFDKVGLSALYARRNSIGLFKELRPIQGYPAVIWGAGDSRANGYCDVSVGVSDSADFNVEVQAGDGPLKADPCGAAQQIAEKVIGHLKGGS